MLSGLVCPFRRDKRRNSVTKMGIFRPLFVPDVAIDLGTANTLVFVKGYGIELSEPSVIAIDMKTDEVVAVGSAAKRATEFAGARKAYTIEEPLAAAIGAGLPVSEPEGSMVVDVGGGTTEVAVISLGGIVTKTSVRVAGNDMDLAIASHIQKNYQVAIGTQTAEQLKIELGSAFPMPEEGAAEVRGRDLVTGLPKTVEITSEEIREAIASAVTAIVEAVRDTLNSTPPEVGSDIMNPGMILAGGGALLKHLDERLRKETGVPVHVAEEPLTCVARGSGRFLEAIDFYQGGVASD